MSEQTVAIEQIQRAERERVAALLLAHADTIAEFAADKRLTVQLVAHLLRTTMGGSDLRPISSALHARSEDEVLAKAAARG